jgi:hypothetical protein
MDSIWAIELELVPTGPLTFRQMPAGILHIMSYPFMPPTTMSGFLNRLLQIAEGGEWPGLGEDWFSKRDQAKNIPSRLNRNTGFRRVSSAQQWHIHKLDATARKILNIESFRIFSEQVTQSITSYIIGTICSAMR